MADNHKTQLTAQQRSRIDSFKDFSKNFAIAQAPASDIIPLLARGEEQQTAVLKTATAQASAAGAKYPLPRFYSSSKSLVFADCSITSDKMAPPKGSINELDQKLPEPVTVQGKVGTKTFDIQAREVDAVKARKPAATNPKMNDPFNKPTDTKPTVHGGDGSFRGKKNHHNNKGRKYNHDRPDQQKTSGEQVPENTNGNGGKWNDPNKSRGGGSSQFNKPGGQGRGSNRSMNTNDNQASQNQPQDQPGHGGYRGEPRRNFTEKLNRPRKSLTNNEGNGPSTSKQFFELQVADPRGFHDAAGNWYSHEMAQAHANMAQQMQAGGPSPHFMHGMVPHAGVPMPVAMPPGYHFGPPPPPFARENGHHLSNMPHSQQQPNQVNIPPPPCVAPKPATSAAQNTPSASASVETVIPAINVISPTVPKGDKKIVNEEVLEAPETYDHRPAQVRIDSLLRTIMAQLEHLKIRIDPTRKPEHKIEPGEMARYLDNAMVLCKMTQTSSEDFVEEYKTMKKHLTALSSTKSAGNVAFKHRDGDAKTGRGLQPRSQSMSPQRTYLGSNMEGASDVFINDPVHDDNKGSHEHGSGIQEFVIPAPEYVGYFIDTSKREQTIEDKNLRIEHRGPWWLTNQHHGWERVNFGTGDNQYGVIEQDN